MRRRYLGQEKTADATHCQIVPGSVRSRWKSKHAVIAAHHADHPRYLTATPNKSNIPPLARGRCPRQDCSSGPYQAFHSWFANPSPAHREEAIRKFSELSLEPHFHDKYLIRWNR